MTEEIAFDLRAAGGSPTGVGRHLLSIVQALAEHRPDLPLRAYIREDVAGLPPGVRTVRIPSGGLLWHARTWWHLRRHPVRAYCSTSLVIPALTGVRCLPVVFDLVSFLYPQHQTMRTRLFERLLMRRVVRRHPLIAGSQTTRRDIERVFGRCNAVVVSPWVSPGLAETADLAVLEHLGIQAPYALYVGTVEPRKNVLTAVRAVASLRRNGSKVRLVIVGGQGWIDKRAAGELASAQTDGALVWTGYLTDADRDAVFSAASCLVLPSVYEGFGLPLLEAMAWGIPCVSSTAPAFEEVAADAALHLVPTDVAAWAAAVERVLRDPEFAQQLVTAGRERAQRYSPARTATEFGEALGQLA